MCHFAELHCYPVCIGSTSGIPAVVMLCCCKLLAQTYLHLVAAWKSLLEQGNVRQTFLGVYGGARMWLMGIRIMMYTLA